MDALLALLQRDARLSHEDLAAQLNLTVDEVGRRVRAFETEGVILGYAAVIDADKTGDTSVTAVIEVKITPEREGGFDRLADRIARFEQVQSCYLMSGGYDLMVVVEGSSLREVASFISEKLSTLAGVIGTATHFRLKAYKENGVLRAPPEPTARLAVSP
jgi:DNA-binding Lrp family transcriptional regulator